MKGGNKELQGVQMVPRDNMHEGENKCEAGKERFTGEIKGTHAKEENIGLFE